MLSVLVTVIVACVLAGLAFYVLREFPLPDPINKIARVAIVVITVVVILFALVGVLAPGALPRL